MSKKPALGEFRAFAEQLMMTNAGRGMSAITEEVAQALMDAWAQGYVMGVKVGEGKK